MFSINSENNSQEIAEEAKKMFTICHQFGVEDGPHMRRKFCDACVKSRFQNSAAVGKLYYPCNLTRREA
jgi:hypothetical protein